MIKGLIIILLLSSISCASSQYYEYDKEKEKYIPVSKITNRGMGVTADHKNKKLTNKVLDIPDIRFKD